MKKLFESIQILTHFSLKISTRTSLINDLGFENTGFDINDYKKSTLLQTLFYMSVIDSCSFMQEYEQVFGAKSESEFTDRIRVVKKINKPFISKIKEWKELNVFRNQIIAHNLRKGENGPFVFRIENLDYNAPRTVFDLYLLSNLIVLSSGTIRSEFEKELLSYKLEDPINIEYQRNSLTKEKVSSSTVELIQEAEIIKNKCNRIYKFNIINAIY